MSEAQEEWGTYEDCFDHIWLTHNGKAFASTFGKDHAVKIIQEISVALREDKKEIERLRGEIEEWRKRCERFRNL